MGGFSLNHLVFLLEGVGWTVVLTALAFLLGSLAGFGVMLLRIARARWVRRLAFAYVQVIQGLPLLILLFCVYFGLGVIGVELSPLVAAAISLMVYCSAFLGEIWRGCVEAVPRTQGEAAECLALSRWQALVDVILPQAARIAVPPTVGFFVQVLKSTSLASVVGFVELTRASQLINNSIFQPFLVFGLAGALYFALCYPLSRWSRRLERKLHVGRRQPA
ncbi:polar amino acid ABC transporter, inner membrane subunit [Methylobacterium sp. 4-46]|uniref:amino acid ABC transporter permease n=1 Tax=unclassified Methylobacterium TaxID=2615210 RepID=UPI000152C2D4|nr:MULTISPECIES: amino acid ABC transporter permease [Methylobacterium]ACA16200.1 polar amino acid ABC transporter, inner membrane subunit [Methylobacterium sp. 4-46]WFT81908.1 amino acid ABC transporter permease [Methylobacterium nodulans]